MVQSREIVRMLLDTITKRCWTRLLNFLQGSVDSNNRSSQRSEVDDHESWSSANREARFKDVYVLCTNCVKNQDSSIGPAPLTLGLLFFERWPRYSLFTVHTICDSEGPPDVSLAQSPVRKSTRTKSINQVAHISSKVPSHCHVHWFTTESLAVSSFHHLI